MTVLLPDRVAYFGNVQTRRRMDFVKFEDHERHSRKCQLSDRAKVCERSLSGNHDTERKSRPYKTYVSAALAGMLGYGMQGRLVCSPAAG